jgi:hypothetical protein
MDLEIIQSIAEIAGGLATVITLIYLALQVRENTAASKRATLDGYVDRLARWMTSLRENQEIIAIYLEGNLAFNDLDRDKKLRYHLLMSEMFSYCESALGHSEVNGLKKETRDATQRMILRHLSQPGAAQWWEGHGRKTCAKDFSDFVDDLIKSESRHS